MMWYYGSGASTGAVKTPSPRAAAVKFTRIGVVIE
jgi:hypothetical protein